jgi:hypothetical protein
MWNIRKFVKTGNYIYAVVPEHPRAIKYGYVLAHIVILENKIGRLLTKEEVSHHIDGNTKNNSPENLEVLTIKEHNLLHGKKHWKHGISRYARGKCRCDICRKANAKQGREHRKKLALKKLALL